MYVWRERPLGQFTLISFPGITPGGRTEPDSSRDLPSSQPTSCGAQTRGISFPGIAGISYMYARGCPRWSGHRNWTWDGGTFRSHCRLGEATGGAVLCTFLRCGLVSYLGDVLPISRAREASRGPGHDWCLQMPVQVFGRSAATLSLTDVRKARRLLRRRVCEPSQSNHTQSRRPNHGGESCIARRITYYVHIPLMSDHIPIHPVKGRTRRRMYGLPPAPKLARRLIIHQDLGGGKDQRLTHIRTPKTKKGTKCRIAGSTILAWAFRCRGGRHRAPPK